MSTTEAIVLYQAVNAINGHRYIGITRKGFKKRVRRHFWSAHSGYGAVIGAAIRKYGDSNIVFSRLAVCPTYEYAKQMEMAAIAAFAPEYNLTKGGDGVVGLKLSAEARKKISDTQKGNTHWLGKKHGPEAKEKIRQSRLSGKGGPQKGKKMNLSDSEIERRRQTANHHFRANWESRIGRRLPSEEVARFCLAGSKKNSKRIICIGTGEEFSSLIGLSRLLKCSRISLRKAINAVRPFNGHVYQFAERP